jgi:hypothetical protein
LLASPVAHALWSALAPLLTRAFGCRHPNADGGYSSSSRGLTPGREHEQMGEVGET